MDILNIILALLLAITISIIVIYAIKHSKLSKKASDQEKELVSLNDRNKVLTSENDSLSKYRACKDADNYANTTRYTAEHEAELITSTAKSKAQSIISSAESEAANIRELSYRERMSVEAEISQKRKDCDIEMSGIIQKAQEQASQIVTQAQNSQIPATQHASEIIQNAKEEAKSIAGDAYKIAEDVDRYRKEATALRNIIEGYGTQYIKPSESVLDGLAEEFGFTEAGQELQRTRELCKKMIDQGLAADSDYVEPYRRNTAIAFILDAFNGKVDSILSTVKATNIGILERKINDAYIIVNRLGSAFRNTKITPEYLNERLNELRWASAVIVLKQKQKEEQRGIKERIREEEKARREYEKTIKEAQKQESAIKVAMEKAMLQIEKANADQRQKYEEKLSELELQLKEAEEKNQRALSMAQQTRSGHVYIISNIGSFGEEVFKIGMTRRLDPMDRVRELGDASVPFPFDVHAMIYSEDAPALETELHKIFASNQVNKVNPKKEFFRIPINDIKEYLDKKDIEIQWTLLAEAAQYRESKALEESFRHDSAIEADWEAKQNISIDELEPEEE